MSLLCAVSISKSSVQTNMKLESTGHEALKMEIKNFVSKSPVVTELSEFLKSLLDRHAPVT